MTMTDERFDATAYTAQVKALRAKFYPTKAPAITSREQPRVVEITRPTYDSVRKTEAVVVEGRVYGPFPMQRDFLFVSSNVNLGKEKQLAREIRRHLARRYDVTLAEMDGDRRSIRVVQARHAAMAEIYVQCPSISLPEIGRMFGGRDHTTVLHAVKKLGVWRRAAS
jgi:hypothetical protein